MVPFNLEVPIAPKPGLVVRKELQATELTSTELQLYFFS